MNIRTLICIVLASLVCRAVAFGQYQRWTMGLDPWAEGSAFRTAGYNGGAWYLLKLDPRPVIQLDLTDITQIGIAQAVELDATDHLRMGLAVNSLGEFIVADVAQITICSPTGEQRYSIDLGIGGSVQWSRVAVDDSNRVYALGNGGLQVYAHDSTVASSFPISDELRSVAVAPDQTVWVVTYSAGNSCRLIHLEKYPNCSTVIAQYDSEHPIEGIPAIDDNYLRWEQVAVGSNRVVVSTSNGSGLTDNNLLVLSQDGSWLDTVLSETGERFNPKLKFICGLVVHGDTILCIDQMAEANKVQFDYLNVFIGKNTTSDVPSSPSDIQAVPEADEIRFSWNRRP